MHIRYRTHTTTTALMPQKTTARQSDCPERTGKRDPKTLTLQPPGRNQMIATVYSFSLEMNAISSIFGLSGKKAYNTFVVHFLTVLRKKHLPLWKKA
ncbi:MAG: hypothetical protein GF350_06990 [Chitinivibrionales bacterium]|nr:hypothetical protein [Chitinivibrionales bacterium]